MSRIARLIIYESDDEAALKKQIAKSLSEGVHNLAVKITISDVTDDLYQQIADYFKLSRKEAKKKVFRECYSKSTI